VDRRLELVYKTMDNKQADNLTVIDFRDHSPFLDYFVIGTVRNGRMAKAVIDELEDVWIKDGGNVKYIDTSEDAKWMLIDLGSIVCHLFYDGEREKYDLEGLWHDLIMKM